MEQEQRLSTKSTLDTISKLLEDRSESSFSPTEPQRKAKASFWSSFGPEAVVTPGDTPSLALAAQFGSDSRIRIWWDQPGFQEWFWNKSEFSQRLEYMAQVALDELHVLMTSKAVAPSARVAAIKIVLEASKKLNKSDAPQEFADDKIAQMTKAQLEEYINKSLKLVQPLTLDSSSDTIDPVK
jgi:hypothetical protein